MKIKIKNKYEEYKEHEGTEHVEDSMTDASMAEDVDIYSCIEKYGIQSLMNKTTAQEYLYLDNTNRNMTLDEAVRQKEQLDEYFAQLPARVRKTFGDNSEIFAQKYRNQEFGDFLETGVLNEEMIAQLTENPSVVEKPLETDMKEVQNAEINKVEEN